MGFVAIRGCHMTRDGPTAMVALKTLCHLDVLSNGLAATTQTHIDVVVDRLSRDWRVGSRQDKGPRWASQS